MFFDNQKKIFKNALKSMTAKKVVFNTMWHLLLQAVSAVFLAGWLVFVKHNFSKLTSLTMLTADLNTLAGLSGTAAIESQISQITWVIINFLVSFLVLVGLIAVAYTFFRGIMWRHFFGKSFTRQYFWKYLKLNLLLFYSFVVLIFVIALTFKNLPSMVLIVLLFLLMPHVCNLIGPSFAKKDRKGLFRHYWNVSIKNFHEFIVPYIMISIGKLIVILILVIVGFTSIPYMGQVAIGVLLFSFFYGTTRFYIAETVKYVESK